ncbi:MAG: 5-methyltetrahydropteroyltriglutamate--homocysteine S-methyltransferase [Bacteroidetes bacterium SW_9_63_38]|nr:MAG: 5-methyltetrahydropteroyltriglutamate--homocysteine S-methyltransferase [Bacteroidetes bacterium SW_9_63_38]
MATASNLGFPRIGAHRELKRAVEGYWKGDLSKSELKDKAEELRETHVTEQDDLGLDLVSSNDFSYYDQVLDTCAMVGAVPDRFPESLRDGDAVDLDTYFAMARGLQEKDLEDEESGVQAMEMTKWFDTNYHYIVPEFSKDTEFSLSSTKPVDEYEEAKELGVDTRPVLIGPVSFLLLGKTQEDDLDALDLLDDLLPVYAGVLQELADAGADAVQLDEPNLVLDLSDEERAAFEEAYEALSDAADLDLHVATYFGALDDNLPTALDLPVDALHLDLVRGEGQLEDALDHGVPEDLSLSLGLIDGRNVWRADLDALRDTVETAIDALGEDRVLVGPSCSLLHVPVDLDTEPALDDDMKLWLAFAKQKVEEIVALADGETDATADLYEKSREAITARAESDWINDLNVQSRVDGIDDSMAERNSPHSTRRTIQRDALNLPSLPTTTIGSFPQTDEVRQMRAKYKKDEISQEEYEDFLEGQIADTIATQEEIGLDVLVHGESERGDMVEYFGRKLDGFLFTENGWVQSYGSRCVRPPIIAGDVSRPEPMTVRWLSYANEQTDKPVKGMLTGPVTILQWSFVRDDQPRAETCRQIALSIRDEVVDLEEAGVQAIQIDEPAFREGLPLRESQWDDYLDWAVECFRLSSCGVTDETQIHTHMCYSEFNDIIEAIADMDADVISVEASRSKMELLDSFDEFDYPNEIGPGVYDIHSPRVPSVEEMEDLTKKALEVLDTEQMWVNPDCGLKTRRWVEVKPALKNMVQAAENVREPAVA